MNKSKTTLNIVKTITNKNNSSNNIINMSVNNKLSSNPLTIANAFNSHFLSVAENFFIKNSSGKNTTDSIDPMTYLRQNLVTSHRK